FVNAEQRGGKVLAGPGRVKAENRLAALSGSPLPLYAGGAGSMKESPPPGPVDTPPRGRSDPSNPSSRPLSQAVRQRIANPPSPVRIREGPLCPHQSLLLASQKRL